MENTNYNNSFTDKMEVEKDKRRNPHATKSFFIFVVGVVIGASGFWAVVDKGLLNNVLVREGGDNTQETALTEDASELESEEGAGEVSAGGSSTAGELLKKDGTKPLEVTVSGVNTLVASNQPAGKDVTMSMISISVNGWVAVYEKKEGVLVTILGARRFNEGKYFGEKIPLLRGTEEGGTYAVVLHADDGVEGFGYKREVPVKDKEGALVQTEFIATAERE